MQFKEYADIVIPMAIYPERHHPVYGPIYCALGVAGEAGEYADKIKKHWRDKEGPITEEERGAFLKELGDVLWYVAASADELDSSLDEIAEMNIDKLTGRRARGTLGGEGDDR